MTDSRPRPGDTVLDPSGQNNRIVDCIVTEGNVKKMLLEDPAGFRFILARHRLGSGWKHVPRVHAKPRFRRERRAA